MRYLRTAAFVVALLTAAIGGFLIGKTEGFAAGHIAASEEIYDARICEP